MMVLKQDTKGLLNHKERRLLHKLRSIEHMAQIEKSVPYLWRRVTVGVDGRGESFGLSTKYGWDPEQKS